MQPLFLKEEPVCYVFLEQRRQYKNGRVIYKVFHRLPIHEDNGLVQYPVG
jgi:hypothetical protein